jgi:hypothetical protein
MQIKTAVFVVLTMIVAAPRIAHARVEAEALVGRPFGVGRVTISGLDAGIDANRVLIEERNGRVFYPALSQGVLGRVLGQVLAIGRSPVGRRHNTLPVPQYRTAGVDRFDATALR